MKNKKALIICYDYPPLPSIGSQRPYFWFKYFKANNIYPIIITRNWNDNFKNKEQYYQKDLKKTETITDEHGTLIKIQFNNNLKRFLFNEKYIAIPFIRKTITFFEILLKWNFNYFDKKHKLYDAAEQYLLNNNVDFILTTGEPFILFKYAYDLSKKFNIPYILDYRDGWATDHNSKSKIEKYILKLEYKYESRFLQNALFYTAASKEIIKQNETIFKINKGYYHPNGVDLDTINKVKKKITPLSSHFTICYSGSLYNQHNVNIFIDAFEAFKLKYPNEQIKINFVGINLKPTTASNKIIKLSRKFPNNINIIDPVSYEKSIEYQLNSHLLLKFDFTGQSKDLLGAKLYEYAATKKPILTILSVNNKSTTFFPEKNIQHMVVNKKEALGIIEHYYNNFKNNIPYTTTLTDDEIASFSREKNTKDFCTHIFNMLDNASYTQKQKNYEIHSNKNNFVSNTSIDYENKKIRALILAYDFPPYVSVGALRPYSWYKYFSNFGIHPIIVTRQWHKASGKLLDYISPGESNDTIINESIENTLVAAPFKPNLANKLLLTYGKNKFKIFRRILSIYYELTQYLFLTGSKSSIYFSAQQYIQKHPIDIIIATGDPFILFKYASTLSKNYNIPWIADYRDPWTDDINSYNKPIIKLWNKYNEKRIVKTARLITTVEENHKIKIHRFFKQKNIKIITNGFNPEILKHINQQQTSNELTICYAGTIYKWHPIKSFLSVMNKFVNETKNCKIKLIFYGINIEPEIRSFVSNNFPILNSHVVFIPKTQNIELAKQLSNNNVMLLFNDYSITGTKIFDYLAINRKIILCYSDGHLLEKDDLKLKSNAQEIILNECNAGICIKNEVELFSVLNNLYLEFSKKGFIECNTVNFERYSRKYQTQLFAEIIKSTI